MDISKMSLVELKAMSFDVLTQIELLQRDLRTLGQAIEQKKAALPEPPKELPHAEGQNPA